ncbi:MAG: hypothetical protein K1V88_05150 [Muribaculaceae bacterium]|jgi:hypothetical protein
MKTVESDVYGRRLGKRLLGYGAWLSLLMATACDVHEFPEDGPPAPPAAEEPVCVIDLHFLTGDMPLYTTVVYDPSSPGGLQPRGNVDRSYDFRYSVDIYSMSSSGSRGESGSLFRSMVLTASDIEDLDKSVETRLPAGDYKVLVWGDYVAGGGESDLYYDTSDFRHISLVSRDDGCHPGNREARDAFRGEAPLTVAAPDGGQGGGHAYVEMKRPLARFGFVTTDVGEFLSRREGGNLSGPLPARPEGVTAALGDYRIVVRYTGYMPSVYNAVTDKPIDSSVGRWFDGVVKGLDTSTAELAFDYVFVNGSQTSVQVALDVYSRHDNTKIASTVPIEVPVVRGKLTEIRGPFLTSEAAGGVGIHPGFDGDFNIEIK